MRRSSHNQHRYCYTCTEYVRILQWWKLTATESETGTVLCWSSKSFHLLFVQLQSSQIKSNEGSNISQATFWSKEGSQDVNSPNLSKSLKVIQSIKGSQFLAHNSCDRTLSHRDTFPAKHEQLVYQFTSLALIALTLADMAVVNCIVISIFFKSMLKRFARLRKCLPRPDASPKSWSSKYSGD